MSAPRAMPRRGRRRAAALFTLALVLLGGLWLDQRGPAPSAPAPAAPEPEVALRFQQAVVMLHARQFDHAATALHRVLVLAPRLPEAHVNMGFALLGLQRPAEAAAAFEAALAIRPDQANAYYGLALAWDARGDRPMALGAMRSYVHLARQERPEHLARARAALWEWQAASAPKR